MLSIKVGNGSPQKMVLTLKSFDYISSNIDSWSNDLKSLQDWASFMCGFGGGL
jgi:hypothetical protein